ncbi:lipopolysaccharide biosynthesis protein [Streptomyces sp. NPDC003487]
MGRHAAGRRRAKPQAGAEAGGSLLRTALLLVLAMGSTAGFSFLFWIVAARWYPADQVGLATSLVSAVQLLSVLSMCGLDNALIRFPVPVERRNAQVSQVVLAVAGISTVVAVAYLLGLPLYGGQLLFVRQNPLWIAMFVAGCMAAAVNLVVKSVFTGAQRPGYNLGIDGLTQGVTKVGLLVVLAALGVAGIVGSVALGAAVSCLLALLVLVRRFGLRVDLKGRNTRLREAFVFSLASYFSNLAALAPVLALPLIVLHHRGPEDSGYYYIAYQIAALLTAVANAIGEALFAEVADDATRLGHALRRSALLTAVALVPAVAGIALLSGPLLSVFGPGYASGGKTLLTVLALASLPSALLTWSSVGLKLLRRMRPLTAANAVAAVTTLGLAQWWAGNGLEWIGYALAIGSLCGGLIATAGLLAALRGTRRQAAAPPQPQPAADAAAASEPYADATPYATYVPYGAPDHGSYGSYGPHDTGAHFYGLHGAHDAPDRQHGDAPHTDPPFADPPFTDSRLSGRATGEDPSQDDRRGGSLLSAQGGWGGELRGPGGAGGPRER